MGISRYLYGVPVNDHHIDSTEIFFFIAIAFTLLIIFIGIAANGSGH